MLKVILLWILLSFILGAIYAVVKWRIRNKCKHKYIIDSAVVMGKRVLLFCQCEKCGNYKDFEFWNDVVKIQVSDFKGEFTRKD